MTPILHPRRRCPAALIPDALWLRVCFTSDEPRCKPSHCPVESVCAQRQRRVPAATWPAL